MSDKLFAEFTPSLLCCRKTAGNLNIRDQAGEIKLGACTQERGREMSTFWLTFKPFDRVKAPLGWPVQHFQDLMDRFDRNPADATEWWRFAAHKKGKVGERALLFKEGVGARGIFGLGTIIGGPARKKASTDHKEMWRVLVRFEKLVDPTRPKERFLVPLKGNEILFPSTLVDAQASGTTVPDAIALELEERCRACD